MVPSRTRFLSVLLMLIVYHGSQLQHHLTPSSSSSTTSTSSPSMASSPAASSSPSSSASSSSSKPSGNLLSWGWSLVLSWLTAVGWPERTGSWQGGAAACVINREQQRLIEMLNQLQTSEDPNLLAQHQIWMRDNHNLTGVCPTFRPGSYSSYMPELEQQSLCPWTLDQNYRTDRFPRLLWFARCLCGHCAGQGLYGRSPSRLYECVPLYHRVSVIREVCTDGEIHFHWGQENVPVGCVCAHPSTRR